MAAVIPEPGDICACDVGGAGGRGIEIGQLLSGAGKWARYCHAFIYTGDGKIVQAEPGGAVEVPLTPRRLMLWSTGKIRLTDAQRRAFVAAARSKVGTPYSWADYGALFAHRLRIPVPGLQGFIADSGHMQCAQMADWCWQQGPEPFQLFNDKRWNGYVMPWQLAQRLSQT